jgi:ketosteroid isomerase-like protein
MLPLLTACLTTHAADATSADVQAINKIEQEWTEAVKTRNKAFYEKYFSDDFTYISENGEFLGGRGAYIDMAMKLPKVTEASSSDEKVTIHGATGVATGRFTIKDSTGVSTTLYTDVFAKGPDGWKAVASQETKAK